MRTIARETAFKAVFASQFSECEKGLKDALYKGDKLTAEDIAYCENVLALIDAHRDEFEKILDSHSKLFPAAGIFPADKSVIFIALAEILYIDDIPFAVSVNEAANIASKYSSERSASFVSGILSVIIKERSNV